MATFNAFILENLVILHKNNQGKIVKDILAFKDELVYNLIGHVRSPGNKDENAQGRRLRKASLIGTVF